MLSTFADVCHKYLFRSYSSILSRISDKIPFAISDLFLWIYQWPALAFLFLLITNVISFGRLSARSVRLVTQEEYSGLVDIWVPLLIFIMYLFLIMFAYYFRTPYWKKLNLVPTNFNFDDELQYVVEKLNNLAEPPQPGPDLWKKMHKAVRRFSSDMDGYDFYSTQRPKKSLFSTRMRKKMGAGALYNPIFPELVMLSDKNPVAYAHESTHGRGHMNEAQTVFNTTIALITSDDEEIVYWGYFSWFQLLIEEKNREDSESEDVNELLQSLNIPAHVSNHYLEYYQEGFEVVQEAEGKLDTVKETTGMRKVIATLAVVIFFAPILIAYLFRQAFLKLTGQKNITFSYNQQPLQYLSSYRAAYLH